MHANAHFLLNAHISLDLHRTNLEVRIHDGSRPWVITHALSRFRQEGLWPTAGYLAMRYLASRPDQLKHTSVAAVTALLQTALETHASPAPA